MTPAEYQALTSPRLSHPARSLYILYLRHTARGDQTQPLDYPQLGKALAISSEGEYRYRVTPVALTALLDELQQAGLLQPLESTRAQHYHGVSFRLPLMGMSGLPPLPARQFAMHGDWRPDQQFEGLARLCGLLDSQFDESELGEFIAYWLGRPESFANQHQWTLKFVRTLKNKRSVKRPATVSNGYQQQPVKAGAGAEPSKRARQMIEEARRLSGQADGDSNEEEDA